MQLLGMTSMIQCEEHSSIC